MTRLGMDIQKRLDDAKANYQRIESQLKNKRLEIEQLERNLLIAQGRKEAYESLLSQEITDNS